jgi:acyl-coenzyme A synthetase/AMP-(fatty) acid ligase
MNLIALIPFELQVALAVLALAGGIYLVFIFLGLGAARTAAIWGSAAAAILLFASRTFKKGQTYEIDRANKAADKAIQKARDARARSERESDGGRLRDDDGFKRRD